MGGGRIEVWEGAPVGWELICVDPPFQRRRSLGSGNGTLWDSSVIRRRLSGSRGSEGRIVDDGSDGDGRDPRDSRSVWTVTERFDPETRNRDRLGWNFLGVTTEDGEGMSRVNLGHWLGMGLGTVSKGHLNEEVQMPK